MAPVEKALLSPSALPAGATHRIDGRGMDVDAGQGDLLRGSNHHTPGCLADVSKHQMATAYAMFKRKRTVTDVTKSRDGWLAPPAR